MASLFIAIEAMGALGADSQIQLALQEKALFYENGAAAAANWIFFFLGELHGLIRKEEAQHKGQGKGEIDAGLRPQPRKWFWATIQAWRNRFISDAASFSRPRQRAEP